MNNIYIKEINFLRFLSILTVLIYHYFPKIIPRGYLGVDLFFVISGFLISLHIYKEIKFKKFRIFNFYNRRIKRIIPATIFLLLFVSLASFTMFTNVDFINYSKSLIYTLFFSSNIFFWLDGGYFGPNDKLKPLLHFWSLSVEEQFYIFFPVLFFFFVKLFKKINTLILAIFIITILSLSLNIFLINLGGLNPAFFLLPTRIWNFSIGVLAMLLFVSNKEKHRNFEIIIYIIMILAGFFYKLPYLPGNFLIIFFSFMLLKKKFPNKFLLDSFIHNKIIQYIGLISFSLYLWHWPILVFVEYYFVYEIEIIIRFLALLVSILLSILSYHFVELNYRYKFKYISVYKLITVSYIFFISFFLLLNYSKNPDYKKNSPDFIADASLTNFKCEVSNYRFYKNNRACFINGNLENDYELAIVGNSHAQMYVPSIKPHLIKNDKQAILLPMTGCLPTLDVNINKDCMIKAKKYFSDYSTDKNIKIIILATTWWHKELFDGEKFIKDPQHKILANSLLSLIINLRKSNIEVFLIGPIQIPQYELPQKLSRLLKFNHINKQELTDRLNINREIYDSDYKTINLFLSQKLNNYYIEPHKIQCDKKKCYFSNNDGIFFADGSHISKNGAKLFVKSFENIIK